MAVAEYPNPVSQTATASQPAQGREVRSTGAFPHTKDARLSLRAVTLLELVSVLGSILLSVWALIPMYPQARWPLLIPAALTVWLVVNSQRLRGESWEQIGFHRQGFGQALQMLAGPMAVAAAMMCLIGWRLHSFQFNSRFALNLLIVPLWGLLQQYVSQAFLYRRVRYLLVNRQATKAEQRQQVRRAIVISATCFAFVHLPNPALTLLTLIAGLVWSWVYERTQNLWALGLSHGLMSVLLMHTMPAWLLPSMSIGFKHFMYQSF